MSLSYDYYPAVLYALDQIGQGRTLTDACDVSNISVATFDRYVKANPELQTMYEEMVHRGNDAMVDALINIDNHRIHGRSDPKMAKVVSDNIKWVVSKRDSKRFGEKIEVKHEITLDRAIVDALEQARNRVEYVDYVDVTPALPAPSEDDASIMDELLS